jgi:hypothetical protein
MLSVPGSYTIHCERGKYFERLFSTVVKDTEVHVPVPENFLARGVIRSYATRVGTSITTLLDLSASDRLTIVEAGSGDSLTRKVRLRLFAPDTIALNADNLASIKHWFSIELYHPSDTNLVYALVAGPVIITAEGTR